MRPTSASPTLPPSSAQADRLRQAFRKGLTPPPRLSVPEWADRYRQLAKEAGSTGGKWETATVEIARGPMLAVTEPGVHVITVMCCTQLMKTALLENVFGYFAHLDPCPMLLLQPKDEAAEQFSKERITPMVRATPVLRELVGTSTTRNASETLLYKAFPGGFLALAGAGSPDNLARRPIRVYLGDEVDKWPVTREGDPLMLVEERTATFGLNWLGIRACSPTVEEESRIEASYADSDQRRASVCCPSCGHRQFLDFFKHVQWEKRTDAKGQVVEHKTRTARIYCEGCGLGWSEGERLRALRTIRWHQTRAFECCGRRQLPLEVFDATWRERGDAGAVEAVWDWWADERDGRYAVYRAKCGDCGTWAVETTHAGFQASKLFSPWQKDKPADIARKWIAAQGDPKKLQAWWNTQAGLPHRPSTGKTLPVDVLLARREVWPGQVPAGVGVLTVGGDLQDDRIELELVGWGRDEESWQVDFHVIEGDPLTPQFWDEVDKYLKRPWKREDGRTFKISAACIDSGNGNHTQKVYEFCKARLSRRIWAIKGESAQHGQRSPVWPTKKPSSRNKKSFRPVILGVNAAKDSIRQRLFIEQPGPGYCHFGADVDIGYFQQLLAERVVLKQVAGHSFRVWELPSGRANEATDCRVYAYGALCGLLHFGLQLNRTTDRLSGPPAANDRSFEEPEGMPSTPALPAAREIPEVGMPSEAAAPGRRRSIVNRLS